MGSAPGTPTPAQPAGASATPTNESNKIIPQEAPGTQASASPTPIPGAKASTPLRLSTTPVPVPRMPGMSPAAAASPSLTPRVDGASVPSTGVYCPCAPPQNPTASSPAAQDEQAARVDERKHQEFADVPGRGSMDFVERMMENLKKASQRDGAQGPDGGGTDRIA